MAFTIIDKQPGGHSGKISIADAGEAVEIWTVVGDLTTYSTEDLRLSGIFPTVYESFHAQNGRLRLQPIDVRQDEDNPSLFVCTLTWNSDKLDPEETDDETNPLNRKARITVKTAFDKQVTHRDFYGKPKVNAAGDLFDPPIENNRMVLVITIRKNVVIFPDWVWEFADAVNSQPFVIKGRRFDTGHCWIADIELGEEQEENKIKFCEARIEIHFKKKRKAKNYSYENCVFNRATEATTCRTITVTEDPADVPNPWDTEQLNEGLIEILDTGTVDGDGNPVTARCRIKIKDPDDPTGTALIYAPAPVPLDTTGARLEPVLIDNATYIVFRDHEYLDFNQISYLWSDR